MKGDKKVIEMLNQALADELTAINQYMVHSEMCANWGYGVLHTKTEKRAIDEMKHAEVLIGRILFLEGLPIVSKLNPMNIGKNVPEMLKNDLEAELGAIKTYQTFIKSCFEIGDAGSRELFEQLLKDEEAHLDFLEMQLEQIEQMGLESYLGTVLGD